MWQVKQFPGN